MDNVSLWISSEAQDYVFAGTVEGDMIRITMTPASRTEPVLPTTPAPRYRRALRLTAEEDFRDA